VDRAALLDPAALVSSVSQRRGLLTLRRSFTQFLGLSNLKELSARFVATELDIASRLVLVAEDAYKNGNKQTGDEALNRAHDACEWAAKWMDRVRESDREELRSKLEELQSALKRLDESQLKVQPVTTR